jgi:hypothetical protein
VLCDATSCRKAAPLSLSLSLSLFVPGRLPSLVQRRNSVRIGRKVWALCLVQGPFPVAPLFPLATVERRPLMMRVGCWRVRSDEQAERSERSTPKRKPSRPIVPGKGPKKELGEPEYKRRKRCASPPPLEHHQACLTVAPRAHSLVRLRVIQR